MFSLFSLDDPKKFKCDRCGRRYQHQGTLSRHKRYECGTEFQFSCLYCSKQFRRNEILRLHTATKHGVIL